MMHLKPFLRCLLFLTPAICLSNSLKAAEEASPEAVSAPVLEYVFEAHVLIDSTVEVGTTARGKQRYIPIRGGHFEGAGMKGEVLPGGADWQTERYDGVTELDALYSIRCDDGTVIIVHNQGIIADGGRYLRTTPVFSAPEGKYTWLNSKQFVGTVSGSNEPNTVIIRFYMVR
ncbi:MAG: DUF3237 family protein [Opitutales bacterium]|nr:DUF3237 family protein [Opitutales bacterium]